MATADSYRWLQVCVGALSGVVGLIGSVSADMGPKFPPRSDLVIQLSFRGGRPEGAFDVALLASDLPPSELDSQPRSSPRSAQSQKLPSLDARLAQEPNGHQWYYCSGPERVAESEHREYYRPLISTTPYPRSLRVAVYFPSRDQLFLTDSVETNRRNNSYSAVFEADGSATLIRHSANSWAEEHYVLQMLQALAGTLIIELAIVAMWIWISGRGASVGPLMLLCLVGNLITVPLVWWLAFTVKVYFELETAWAAYLFAEVLAVFIEGFLYAKFGKLQWSNAIYLAMAANGASFLCGCCLVSYY